MNLELQPKGSKLGPVTFHEKLKDVDADSIHDLNQFIETIDEIRTSSLKDGKGFRETKYVPKSYWNDKVKTTSTRKKL